MFDVLIIGAGPAGLACAIEAGRKGLSCEILDKGSLVDAIRRFPTNMTFFSTPELLELGGVPFISSAFRPSRVDTLRYYRRVAEHFRLQVRSNENVHHITKTDDAFRIVTSKGVLEARRIVVATGYFDSPIPFDVPGSTLPKVSRTYTEPYPYVGREVAIVGGKNSAVDAALEMYRNGVHVTVIHRGMTFSDGVKYWMLPDIENRRKAGEIKVLFGTEVKEIRERSIVLRGSTDGEIPNDHLFVLIGYRPDTGLLQEIGVPIDPDSLAPVHDAATMETPVKGVFVAGSIAAGRFNNRIFIENGRLHGKLIVDAICTK